MSRVPRLLPMVAVAIGGVLAVRAIAGAPELISATKAFAEDVGGSKAKASTASAAAPAPAPPPKPAAACAPTAAELAKEAGLSPAELQVLQSLGDRRGELDHRETDLDTQVQLIAAAQAKLDARIQQMNGLKADIQGLLGQADQQAQAETDRLVRVYEAMKPKDAAARITLMDDSVRLPMASKMKERALSAILAQMPAEDAKALTEKLANRVDKAKVIADAKTALNPPAAPATPQMAQNVPPAAGANTPGAVPAAPAKPHKRAAKAKPANKAVAAKKPAPAADASGTAPAPAG
ncbi:MAG: MotE family protein [Caulobacteraceae bacterium]|nr:MotE family protein [Caulobacteraceae bacterium]